MSKRRSLRYLISLMLFTGAASTALAQDLVELPPLDPQCNHRQNVETAIAVDPLNPCDAVAVWFSFGEGEECSEDTDHEGWYATTRDGWDTVHIGQFEPLTTTHQDPSVVYDSYEGVFWAAFNAVEDGDHNILYAKSSIDGLTNNIVFDETDHETLVAGGATDKPWIAVGRRPSSFSESNLYLGYTRMQCREYALRATGWVRFITGVQSLISVYLLALWLLTYFGRPFE